MSDYLAHILLWMGPIVLLQWAIAWRTLRANWRAVVVPTLLIGSYYTLADMVAVREGIWHFDDAKITGLHLGPLPIEEVLFFYLTALLVAQTFVMLLPGRYRRPAR